MIFGEKCVYVVMKIWGAKIATTNPTSRPPSTILYAGILKDLVKVFSMDSIESVHLKRYDGLAKWVQHQGASLRKGSNISLNSSYLHPYRPAKTNIKPEKYEFEKEPPLLVVLLCPYINLHL